ncbi:zinc-ribbon domain-containing protein [Zavarzinella formosa]|uniref:zinc-ribbon domain-containing protein n=1 Tax=Zavarzinella formosa TaxID=360055 RepID=UPI00036AE665
MTLIKCPECGHKVPEHAISCPKCGCLLARERRGDDEPPEAKDPGLRGLSLFLWFLLFLAIPFAAVILSSSLYYAWREKYPKCAGQINMLGFVVFGIHCVAAFAL